MTAQRMVIAAGTILTGPAWEPTVGDILIDGDRIEAVGPPGAFGMVDAARHDASRHIVIPGLVNAHTHSHTVAARGMAREWTLEASLLNGSWMAGERSHEMTQLGTLLLAAEALRSGTTAVFDLVARAPRPSLDALEATVRGYELAGIRATIAPMVADIATEEALDVSDCCPVTPTGSQKDSSAAAYLIDVSRQFAAGLAGHERVSAAVAPTILAHCTRELCEGLNRVAAEFDLRIHTHVAESKPQALVGQQRFGSIVTELDRRGLLNERLTAAHAIWLTGDDRARLGASGAVAVMVPGSNLRLGSGIADARGLLEAGTTLAIGTDGANSSDAFDMVDAARLTSLVSRVDQRGPHQWLSVSEVLDAATVGGARALGLADVGRIAAGQSADLTFVSARSSAFRPANDIANQLLTAARAGDVTDVMVAGRFVLRDRELPDIDIDAAYDRFDTLTEEFFWHVAPLRAHADEQITRARPVLDARRAAQTDCARLLIGDAL